MNRNLSPWLWVPTLYLAEGIPYFLVNTIALIMFKDMGMDNGTLALVTSLISLPWVLKPFWSPFVDILRSKRWWVVAMQAAMAVSVALIAFSVNLPVLGVSLAFFVLTAFASATHDIAADGFYMLALDNHKQSAFIGIRNTFYRIAMVFGQGVLVVLAGWLEKRSGSIPLAWSITLGSCALLLGLASFWHSRTLPRPSDDGRASAITPREVFKEFGRAFATFFTRREIWIAMAFMLLYRLPEALSVKMLYPFFKDGSDMGGLGLGAQEFGLLYGTFGVIALLAGGILGGLASSKAGLRKMMWPMAASLALPCAVYLIMAILRPASLILIGALICFDQFGYGFGFTAYTLYMMYFSSGEFKTSHYAICTAFMAMSMMLPGLAAGYLQQSLGYVGFFILVMLCCLATFAVTFFARKGVSPDYGK
ncbi:MAG: MFS transporter [Bacteroidales bacterium]|nr:MFS transporter [Bacteroidales bacterium]